MYHQTGISGGGEAILEHGDLFDIPHNIPPTYSSG